ncbi:MAG: hypothetical protein WCI50_10690 [Actinomycetes bacterium]
MAILMTHFYPGGTAEQQSVVHAAVHPDGALPDGQLSAAFGPTEGGWLISALWESPEALDRFRDEVLMPALAGLTGGFQTAPEERLAEVVRYDVR